MKPTREQLRELLKVVEATAPDEIDCEEFLARVSAFVEAYSDQAGIPNDLRKVAQHAKVCSECREEVEALAELLSDS